VHEIVAQRKPSVCRLAVETCSAVVSIYSDAEYVSYDLDFIPTGLARKVDAAMESAGSGRTARSGFGSSSGGYARALARRSSSDREGIREPGG